MTQPGIQTLTPNVRTAIYDFILNFATPEIDPASVLYGNQNNIALPASNDYIVFSPLNIIRHGTGVEQYTPTGSDELTLLEQVEMPVQIDCYANTAGGSDGMDALTRAQALETISRSSVGVAFLASRGFSCLYADEPRDTTIVGDSDNYIRRWTLTLHLSFKAGLVVPMSFFNTVTEHIDAVDALTRSDS